VEELVRTEFPHVNVLRWDADTTRQKGSEEILLSHFANHRADSGRHSRNPGRKYRWHSRAD
jgi:primosomal protein N'